jgi:ABC-type Fe3+-hydroxamate transport system substrate-binding protein
MLALGGGQWKLNVRLAGESLGRTNDAEQLLIDYDHEAALARKAIRAELGGAMPGGASGSGKPRVAVALATAGGIRFAKRDSFAGTILADAGVKQVQTAADADVTLLSAEPNATAHIDGRVIRVDGALWWGPGGAFAAKAALKDLKQALAR